MLHCADTVVELVGRNAVDPLMCHGHGGVGLETRRTQHGDQHASLVFAYAAAVGEVHFGIVQCVALALSHADSGVADIVGHPVGQDADAVLLALCRLQQLLYFCRYLRRGDKAAVVLVHPVEPDGFRLPVRRGAQQQLRLHVIVGQGMRLMLQRNNVPCSEIVCCAVATGNGVRFNRAVTTVVEGKAQPFGGQHIHTVVFHIHRHAAPKGDNIVKMAAHGRNVPVVLAAVL